MTGPERTKGLERQPDWVFALVLLATYAVVRAVWAFVVNPLLGQPIAHGWYFSVVLALALIVFAVYRRRTYRRPGS